jgi:hypothetical protein
MFLGAIFGDENTKNMGDGECKEQRLLKKEKNMRRIAKR